MTIVTVVGARLQFVKRAALWRELLKVHNEVLIHTGNTTTIKWTAYSSKNRASRNRTTISARVQHASQAGRILIEIEKVLELEKPDLVLVYGDANSTLAGALAATKLKTKIAMLKPVSEAMTSSCRKRQTACLPTTVPTSSCAPHKRRSIIWPGRTPPVESI
jgi:UDP-N-acetylglucosamine 2-epimerase